MLPKGVLLCRYKGETQAVSVVGGGCRRDHILFEEQ